MTNENECEPSFSSRSNTPLKTAPHLAYTILGGFIVLFGMFSLWIKEKAYIGEAVIATLIGIIFGPYVANLFDPRSWAHGHVETINEITLEVTRVVIAIGVFAVGVELPKAYMKRHWRSLAMLLGPVMVWGWFISALLIWGLIPGLSLLSSLVIAACVTPTDPILAQAVVGGKFADKHVPAHLRHLLSAESGSNDGAAFPFLYIALYLILDHDTGEAVGQWFYITWVYNILLGVVLGSLLGFAARKLMKFCESHNLIDRQSFVAQYISLAMLSIGMTTLLGSDDLLAAFCCGTAFAWDGFFNKATEESYFSNVIDLLFNITAFIYIGAILPFDQFGNPELTLSVWRLVVLMILVMILRRIPIILALYRWVPDIKTFREALFVGHFGPMGVGAIFISTLAATKLPEPVYPPTSQVELLSGTIQPIVHFFVLASVLIHGLSIPFFSLGRRVHSISRTHSIGITRTWSRRPSFDGSRPEPGWTSQVARAVLGGDIVINRDEEDVAERGEAASDDSIQLKEKRNVGDEEAVDDAEEEDTSESSTTQAKKSTRTDGEDSEKQEDGEEGIGRGEAEKELESPEEENKKLEDDGQRTPPLAEYREGRHLVIERKRKDGEVDVEVIRDKFPHEGIHMPDATHKRRDSASTISSSDSQPGAHGQQRERTSEDSIRPIRVPMSSSSSASQTPGPSRHDSSSSLVLPSSPPVVHLKNAAPEKRREIIRQMLFGKKKGAAGPTPSKSLVKMQDDGHDHNNPFPVSSSSKPALPLITTTSPSSGGLRLSSSGANNLSTPRDRSPSPPPLGSATPVAASSDRLSSIRFDPNSKTTDSLSTLGRVKSNTKDSTGRRTSSSASNALQITSVDTPASDAVSARSGQTTNGSGVLMSPGTFPATGGSSGSASVSFNLPKKPA